MKGERIGSYRVERLIGQGGMGAVYEAVHEQLGRRAAIKLLRRELSQDPQIAMRFFREARAANRVEHSGIVAIYEFGHLPDGTAYIIMEFLRGEALSARLRSRGGRLPYGDAVRIARQIASALAVAHAQDVIHRDLKPDNVMLVPDSEMPGGERVKILDFGVAKVDNEVGGLDADDFKTDTGMVLGTASYMPPEQCKGAGNVTDKADVYSLGVVMYRMLCGQLPFRAEGQGEVMAMHIFSTPKPLREHDPNIPTPLTSLVERMMAKDPNERPTMAQVASELERVGGIVTPGAMPVVVVSGSGPITTGSTPTLSPGLAAAGDSRDRSGPVSSTQAAEAAAAPRRTGRSVLLGLLVLTGSLVGGAFTAQHLGLVKLPIALPAAIGGLLHKPPPPPPPPPPQKLVRWTLSSEPAGAEVLDKASRSVLGTTPWFREQASATGKQALIVRAPGFLEAELELDQAQDASPHIRLSAGGDLGASAAADAGVSGAAGLKQANSPAPAVDLGAGPRLGTPPATKPAVPVGTPPLRVNPPVVPKKRPTNPAGGGLRDEDLPTSLPED
jgi:serine/threonine-protein kinase